MPSRFEQMIVKAKRPPSLVHWVRINRPSRTDTAIQLKRLLLGSPPFSLAPILALIEDMVTLGVSFEQAKKAIYRLPNVRVRELGLEVIEAFHAFQQDTGIEGISVFRKFSIPYPIGRGVTVPIRPTFVMLAGLVPVPVFVIPWANDPLSDFQKRLLTSIVSDAILTLEDFQNSYAIFVMTPKVGSSKIRQVKSWTSNDIIPLTRAEILGQQKCFLDAMDEVLAALREMELRGEFK